MELAHLSKARIVYTERTFYKKYSYKLCFVIDYTPLSGLTARSSQYWSTRTTLRRDLRKKLVAAMPDVDYRTREEGRNVNIFLDDDAVANMITLKFQESLEEVHMPLNEQHKQLMHGNHRIRIRNKLFYNKYRYKVHVKNFVLNRFTNFEKLKYWLNSLDVENDENRWAANNPLKSAFDMSEEERTKPKFVYRFSDFAVFLNEEQDVMMLQLWLNEWYGGTEKAVLISEI